MTTPWEEARLERISQIERAKALTRTELDLMLPETTPGHTVGRHRPLGAIHLGKSQQPRERSVPCALCRRDTFNTDAICDNHQEDS